VRDRVAEDAVDARRPRTHRQTLDDPTAHFFFLLASAACCGGEAGDRHAVRRARHVVEPTRWQKSIELGSPPCSPQMPILRPARTFRTLGDGDLHQLADALLVEGSRTDRPAGCRCRRRREERSGVVAREAEAHLRQVVGAEREELGLARDLVRR
jgi:hypothetical protein